ncbi:uncharacterized protein LOC116993538 isoform X2 [Catharus ustulatus]|uniref:uncharacterized protein LOC116993538 isoform X2 n=1 Tax=Catharus ustulatus TaxID=91951 RepID=UPI0014083C6B|nr:uncharacterized protein LOC116993538 isoform X2 [Catharus ustulatus]
MCMEPAPKPCMQSMALPIPHTRPSSPPGGKHEAEDGCRAAPPAGVGGSREPRGEAMSLCQSPGCSCGTDRLPGSGADLALSCLFGLGGCLQRAGAAPLRALGLRNKAVQALPSSARRAVARRTVASWLEGLSVGLGPASTGDEWIAAGEQGSTAPCHGCAGASNPLSAAEDKDTRDDEELVLSQGPARACGWGRACWWEPHRAGGVGSVRARLWLCCVPWQRQGTAVAVPCPLAASGHGCGCAVSLGSVRARLWLCCVPWQCQGTAVAVPCPLAVSGHGCGCAVSLGSVRARLWLCCVPWQCQGTAVAVPCPLAVSGHGCGCAVSLGSVRARLWLCCVPWQCQGTAVAVLCPQQGSVLALSGCLRGAAKHFLSSTAPVLLGGDDVVRPTRSQLEGMGWNKEAPCCPGCCSSSMLCSAACHRQALQPWTQAPQDPVSSRNKSPSKSTFRTFPSRCCSAPAAGLGRGGTG